MDYRTTQSVGESRSHAERGNEARERGNEAEAPVEQQRSVAFWSLLVLIVVAAGLLVVIQRNRPEPPNPWVGRGLPSLEVTAWLNTAGPLSADDLRGKVVLLDFWMTTCGPCVAQLPKLASLNERFEDHGLLVVGLTPESDSGGHLKSFIEIRPELTWPIGYGAGFTFEMMQIYGTPTYVLYDRTGRSVWGGHSLRDAEDAIVAALAKN